MAKDQGMEGEAVFGGWKRSPDQVGRSAYPMLFHELLLTLKEADCED